MLWLYVYEILSHIKEKGVKVQDFFRITFSKLMQSATESNLLFSFLICCISVAYLKKKTLRLMTYPLTLLTLSYNFMLVSFIMITVVLNHWDYEIAICTGDYDNKD